MHYPTLYKTAYQLVSRGSMTTWEKLKESHKSELTTAAVKDIGLDAIECIYLGDTFKNKLIEVLEEEDIRDRNILLKELGELVVKAAMDGSKNIIEENLEEVLPIVAEQEEETLRDEIEADAYEHRCMIYDDNHQQV